MSRRSRNRTLEELIVISYLVYPKYFDSYSGEIVSIEDVIKNIVLSKEETDNELLLTDKVDNDKYIRSGFYKHYRGDLYQVLYVARSPIKEEKMIVYRRLSGDCEVLINPISMFTEMVTIEDSQILKFELIKAI